MVSPLQRHARTYEALRRLEQARRRLEVAEQAYYDAVAGRLAAGERMADLVAVLSVSRWTVYRHAGLGTPDTETLELDLDGVRVRALGRVRATAALRTACTQAKAVGVTVADIARTLEVTRGTVYFWLSD